MIYLLQPPTEEDYIAINDEFYKKWNFPNVVGCIDGKHIRIRCPNRSGSIYYNYKDFFSIVLMAVVDANSKFIAIDVGSFGREGDSGIFSRCNLGKSIKESFLPIPPPKKLPDTDVVLPHVILGDEAFPLLPNLMKPYPRSQSLIDRSKAIFNYRLSRSRRIVENAFGILTSRFRIFSTPIHLNVTTVENVVVSACILHNILSDDNRHTQSQLDADPSDLISIEDYGEIEGDFGEPKEIRDKFKDYFNGTGAVSWQNETIRL
ncbi:putative nuclease HARBI1 [Sitodiplosis mosellana]|uniref:putative nuclease HARBI1 n=1 Tax=Sitodiplosis mosellana TaxID=263140 RepID=UPI002444CA25|nr:putative nuclease HARBI1 [Sitodiplosis mosellana]